MSDWLKILRRLSWAMPWTRRRYSGTPWPWTRCHCGALADVKPLAGSPMCWPCKYAGHPTCECSDPETWASDPDVDASCTYGSRHDDLTEREDRS